MMKSLLFAFLLSLFSLFSLPSLSAQKVVKTTRKGRLQRTEAPTGEAAARPTEVVAADSALVRFSGYGKTARATRETVFVTNRDTVALHGVAFTIDYRDTEGRQLHSRRVWVADEVPAGQTRRLDFPSWDPQHTFYYHLSPRPRTPAIPYRVKIHADSVVVIR